MCRRKCDATALSRTPRATGLTADSSTTSFSSKPRASSARRVAQTVLPPGGGRPSSDRRSCSTCRCAMPPAAAATFECQSPNKVSVRSVGGAAPSSLSPQASIKSTSRSSGQSISPGQGPHSSLSSRSPSTAPSVSLPVSSGQDSVARRSAGSAPKSTLAPRARSARCVTAAGRCARRPTLGRV